MKIVRGDLLDLAEAGEFDAIVHGCNCMCVMGAGIAKQIKQRFPEAYETDREGGPSENKLGLYTETFIRRHDSSFWIVNAYTQLRPGSQASEHAIRRVFQDLRQRYQGKRIGYPRIGTGLGGGDWNSISKIIDVELYSMDHTLVEYISRYV